MTTSRRIALTVALVALWLLILAPFTVAGVLSTVTFVAVVALTAVAIMAIWVRRPRSSAR
jgi:hypothetical protein